MSASRGLAVGVDGCGAGGVEDLRPRLVEPLGARGWTVAVTITPTAAQWLGENGELGRLEAVTGLPFRSRP